MNLATSSHGGQIRGEAQAPFFRIRRCRSLKVGSNEVHSQESNDVSQESNHVLNSQKQKPPSPPEKSLTGQKAMVPYSLTPPAEERVASTQSLVGADEAKRRRSEEWRRRRRRTFDGAKERMREGILREGSLQILFRESELTEAGSCSENRGVCSPPILQRLSTLFGAKKQVLRVKGATGTKVPCVRGLSWATNLQNYKPLGYKLFTRRKKSLTLVRCKKDVPVTEDLSVSRVGGGATGVRKASGRELSSSPISPPVTLARSEEACPFVVEKTSVYDESVLVTDPARISSYGVREQVPGSDHYDYGEDEDLGLDEEDDAYPRKCAGVPQAPPMVFYIRPRRCTLAPSRFQREHLERLRNAAKVSPTRRNSEDL